MKDRKYRSFTVKPQKDEKSGGKPSYAIVIDNSGDAIGLIGWYPRRRKWCFAPLEYTMWSSGCLTDVQDAIDTIAKEEKP